MISAKAVSYTEGYRSGHNEAVLKTVWVNARTSFPIIRRHIEAVITRRSWKFASTTVAKTQKSLVNTDFSGTPKASQKRISKNISKKNWISDDICHTAVHRWRVIEAVITRRSWKFASDADAKRSKSRVNTGFSGTSETSQKRISKNISKKFNNPMISAKAVSYTEGYRSGHNEAVLKTRA